MPLWDSVQRSLEKASHEAARIAKTQRLRSTIDGLSRQITTQQTTIFNRTMDLFLADQLTQDELLSLCQELVNYQQQLNQAQFELKQLQSSQAQSNASNSYQTASETGSSVPIPYPPVTEEPAPATYTPPAYQAYLDSTQGASFPPPPPGVGALTLGSMETVIMTPPGVSPADRQVCQVCQADLSPSVAFCHNCGAPVQDVHASHSPTVLAGEPGHAAGDSNTPVEEAQGNEGV
jgi:hypothetical protein